jgi:hypothetical protein
MGMRSLTGLGLLVATTSLHAAAGFSVEQPAGTTLTSSATVYFGGMQWQYVDPATKTQAPDGTFTVTFTGIPASPYNTYHLQTSAGGVFGWFELFAPGLAPNGAGVIEFHDPTPRVSAFYRLLILTDTQRVFTLRNTGPTDLTDLGVSVFGPDSANFTLDTSDMDTTLSPEASTTFSVIYLADDPNSRSAELRISLTAGEPFTLNLSGGDLPPEVPRPSLAEVSHIPAGPGAPAGIAGKVSGGPTSGSVVLEASSDLNQLDPWQVIATIPLDTSGNATFGTPNPITDPGSTGSRQNFYRLRVL